MDNQNSRRRMDIIHEIMCLVVVGVAGSSVFEEAGEAITFVMPSLFITTAIPQRCWPDGCGWLLE